MLLPSFKRPSALSIISILVTGMVAAVFTLLTIHNLTTQQERITRQMEIDAQRSLNGLARNIAPFMESYAVREYEKLVSTEVELERFFAIRVEDIRLGNILGMDRYVTGTIQGPGGSYVKYSSEDDRQEERLSSIFYSVQAPILSSTQQTIGKVSIHITDDAIREEFENIMIDSITASIALALALILTLIYATKRLFIHPLYEISSTVAQRDEDGIPRNPAPEFRYREIATLSNTINTMRTVSRNALNSVQMERNRLQNVINSTDTGIWEWHVQSGKTFLNERWAEMIGYTIAELEPITLDTLGPLVHPTDLELIMDRLQHHFAEQTPNFECEARLRHKEGHWIWVLSRGKLISRDADGKPLLMYGTHQDITKRKQAEEQLKLAAGVFENAKEGVLITDVENVVVDVNDAFTQITGYTREEIIGQSPRLMKSGRQTNAFYARMWRDIRENGYWSGEIWNRRKSGEIYPELLTISSVTDDKGEIQNYIALFADISALKEHERQLEHVAHYDILTGLPNRLLLGDRLRQSMTLAKRHRQPLAIVFLDLDGFKEVNDRFGHDIGDRLLVEKARSIKAALREEDTLARLGGDEFVAVLPNLTDTESCLPILERILEASSQQLTLNAQPLKVSASLGIAFFLPGDETDADQLLRQADQAMYQAKLNGKNRYHIFDTAQDRSLRSRHGEIEHIRQAFLNKEFELYYQPQVDLLSGKVIGAEALIRWNHPSEGVLPPVRFLPLIEDHELMVQLGEWTLEQALDQISCWQEADINLPVSVNIAAVHLQHPDFLGSLQAALERHPNVSPSDLKLEVLETSALDNMLQVSQVMRDCQSLGVMFALDDFGTGYSSLSYLKHLPVHTLKIDQSFVRDMLEDSDNLAILKGVLGLAEAFNLEVIAEGMETEAHGKKLLSLGCTLAQGYGIARPMPAGNIPDWILTGNRSGR